jgi:hypothetical protein
MNKENIIIGLIVVLGALVLFKGIEPQQQFGQAQPSFSGGTQDNVTVASSTVTQIFSAGNIKTKAIICNVGGQRVDLFVASSTATGQFALNRGIILNPFSSSTQVCADFSGLQGYLYGLATGGTVVVSRSFE